MLNEMTEYLRYSANKESLFYSKSLENTESRKPFEIPKFDKVKWAVYSDDYWSYFMFKEKDFPDQGWKIHITADLEEASRLLYDVAEYLFREEISFKYVPNFRALSSKNVKYANRGASGKFITVYPENNEVFYKLLNDLKIVTESYKLGPYILNDQQWQGSNVFFRYGGLKRVTTELNGEKVLAIKRPDGTYIPDERLPYYHLPDFVEEPDFLKENNTFPSQDLFNKLKDFNIIEVIHHSNAGGVYIAEFKGKKVILKEGRHNAGTDGNGKCAFERNKNEYYNLKRLESVEGVINAHEYFTAWRHNYFTEDFHEGGSLREFIAREFPFTKSKERTMEYADKCIDIIKQLEKVIEEIHEKGIAMGDLSLNNIMLSEDDLKVTLIDFEVATSLGRNFIPTIATPGFISSEANNFMEADWFAVYRIARMLFLPIVPVHDIAPQIIHIHDNQIKAKFGEKIITLLKQIENKVSKYTNLRPQSPFLNQKLSAPAKELSIDNIDYFISGLQKGILNNLEIDSISLIKGNIEQYNNSINKYNIAYGSFGVILSLIRSGENFNEAIKLHLSDWFDLIIPYIEKESEDPEINPGLFHGFSGIITVLYELGYKESALLVLENILTNFNEDKIDAMDDISILSGLSGIGLLYLSFYKILDDNNTLLKSIRLIYNKIISIYSNNKEDVKSVADFGLLTGWSGAALFLVKSSLVLDEGNGRSIAFELLDESFEPAIENEHNSDDLFIIDESRGFERLIPYIGNGSSGIALTMLEFQKEDESYLNDSRKKILDRFIDSNSLFCSANGGFMNGYVGLLPLANAVSHSSGDNNMIKSLLNNLNNYFVRKGKDEILLPGDYGFKCSMDISGGAAGALLILSDVKKGVWGSWLPLPYTGMEMFNA
ncbi:class III lanthionine synthetase LanKC [Rossellomorea sp. YZS02]|uniref:class III lanthionine synthetase LanKC n=1 Tax=Rossellomorea sp. YZS02 TaxID=3097358 RepID=UPI002A0AA6A0|nr:class III lanthionine synthetase LanKC [Rossellomorea sp. YZS02]MDX8344167.1 class III lanthionine synthetase LanKC [Rossellomorea sp. YZS02]